jgi:hypothetical protein
MAAAHPCRAFEGETIVDPINVGLHHGKIGLFIHNSIQGMKQCRALGEKRERA